MKKNLTSEIHSSAPQEHQKRENDDISVIIENKIHSYFNVIEKQFMKIEHHFIGPSYPKWTTWNVASDNFKADLIKKVILEMEKKVL